MFGAIHYMIAGPMRGLQPALRKMTPAMLHPFLEDTFAVGDYYGKTASYVDGRTCDTHIVMHLNTSAEPHQDPLNVLVHETGHMVEMMLQPCGMVPDAGASEPWRWGQEWLFREGRKGLRL